PALRAHLKPCHLSRRALHRNNVTLTPRANTDDGGTPISPTYPSDTFAGDDQTLTVTPAFSRVSLANIALAAGVSGGAVHSTDSPIVAAQVGTGTQVSAGGAITVKSQSYAPASIDAFSISAGLGAGIGIVIPTVKAE